MIIELSFTGRDWSAYRGIGEIEISLFYEKKGLIIKKLGEKANGWYGSEPSMEGWNFPGGSFENVEGKIPPKPDIKMIYYDTEHLTHMPEWIFISPGIQIQEGDEDRLNEFAEVIELETHTTFRSMKDYLDALCY